MAEPTNGSDTISGTGRRDIINALQGNDRVLGKNGNDDLFGDEGNDTLYGQSGDDLVDGGLGNDYLSGGKGADILKGGEGDDTYLVLDAGDAVVEEGTTLRDSVTARIDYALTDNVEILRLVGTALTGQGNELDNDLFGSRLNNNLYGEGGRDHLRGAAGDDGLYGGVDRDLLRGGTGDDLLEGGEDNDRLWGDAGQDALSGGSGRDLFVFRSGESSSDRADADVIIDFSQFDNDQIHLRVMDANTTIGGNQNFTLIFDGAFSGAAGELRYEQVESEGATYIEGDVNGDSLADFSIKAVGLIDFQSSDFLL